jgi:hypothetical protein
MSEFIQFSIIFGTIGTLILVLFAGFIWASIKDKQ